MKIFQSSIFRALCAIATGALLVKYREETVTWMTITIGTVFFISGVISCVAWFSARRKSPDVEIYDAQGRPLAAPAPSFPIVGMGSIILGGMLALAPNTFVNGLVYVLAAILILGALNLFFNLATATKFAHIGCAWWVLPAVILLVGLVAVVKPSAIASMPLLVIGWGMMVYGVVELTNAIKLRQCRNSYEKAHSGPTIEVEATTTDVADEQ